MQEMPTLEVESGARPETVSETRNSDRNLYLALFLAGLAMRLGLMFWKRTYMTLYMPWLPFSYGYEAGSIAEHVARGLGFSSPFGQESGPTAWLAPVYPLLIALSFKIFGVYSVASRIAILCLNSAFGAATAVTMHMIGKRTVGRRVALLAAWVWALSPFFYRWAISWVWEFALSAFLLTLLILATLNVIEHGTRSRWLIFGALWGFVAITNPALLSLLPVTGLYAAFHLHRQKRPWFRSAVLSAILFWLVISPVMLRNYRTFHQLVFMRGNFWFEFYLGNYHFSNGLGYLGKHPSINPVQFVRFRQLGEAGYIAWAKQQSLQYLREHPAEFIELTQKRGLYFWSGQMLNYVPPKFEWWQPWKYWPLSVAGWMGVIFLFTRRPKGWFLLASTALVYPIPYYLTYPVAKYRHAIEPELVLMAAFAFFVLWDEVSVLLRRRRTVLLESK